MTDIFFTTFLAMAFLSTATASTSDNSFQEDDEFWNPRAALLEEVTGTTVEEVCASYMAFFVGSDVQADFKTNCVCTGNVDTTIEVNCRDECEFTHPHGSGHYVYSDRLQKFQLPDTGAVFFASLEDRECLEFTKDHYNGITLCGVNEYIQGHFDITIDGSMCNHQTGYQAHFNDRCLEGDCSNVFPLTGQYNTCDPKTLEGPLRVYFDDHPLEAGSCPVVSATPTAISSDVPTTFPTTSPSSSPSILPSAMPTENPTKPPTSEPSSIPSTKPSQVPSAEPTFAPSNAPTLTPTKGRLPTVGPSKIVAAATAKPTSLPTVSPVAKKGKEPAGKKGKEPSTVAPTTAPSISPTVVLTVVPSSPASVAPSTAQVSGASTVHVLSALMALLLVPFWM